MRFWKIYYVVVWVFLAFTFIGGISLIARGGYDALFLISSVFSLVLMIVGLSAVRNYTYQFRQLTPAFWKVFWVVLLVYNVAVLIYNSLDSDLNSSFFWIYNGIHILIVVPMFIASWRYAFRFPREKSVGPEISEPE